MRCANIEDNIPKWSLIIIDDHIRLSNLAQTNSTRSFATWNFTVGDFFHKVYNFFPLVVPPPRCLLLTLHRNCDLFLHLVQSHMNKFNQAKKSENQLNKTTNLNKTKDRFFLNQEIRRMLEKCYQQCEIFRHIRKLGRFVINVVGNHGNSNKPWEHLRSGSGI